MHHKELVSLVTCLVRIQIEHSNIVITISDVYLTKMDVDVPALHVALLKVK